ncbi:MAG: hypothetical protein ACRC6G_01685 [Deefgea sp.]
MKRILPKLSILAASLMLSACATVTPNANVNNGQLLAPAGEGLALLSLTVQSKNLETANTYLYLEGPTGRLSLDATMKDHHIRAANEPKRVAGRLFIQPLPPGEYRLVLVAGSWRDSSNLMFMYPKADIPLDVPFTIKAGEVTYLGEVRFGLSLMPKVDLVSNTERDFYDLKTRSGVTDFSNIIMRPLNAAATVQ